MRRVYGPDFMIDFVSTPSHADFVTFFTAETTASRNSLPPTCATAFLACKSFGTYTASFRAAEREENRNSSESRRVQTEVIWVGLSTPKQERFMAQYIDRLDTELMVGVGAAFEFSRSHDRRPRPGEGDRHAMVSPHAAGAPASGQALLINNPVFSYRIMMQFTGLRRYSL